MSGRVLFASLVLAALVAIAGPVSAQSRPMFVAPGVTFPETGGVVRAGQNGLVVDDGVASVDESDQYSLLALSVDADPHGVIRFTYGDAWTLAQPRPSSCVFTVRRVERTLTQTAANDLARTLADIEMQRLKEGHPLLAPIGERQANGAVVKQIVDRFTWTETVPVPVPEAEAEAEADTAADTEADADADAGSAAPATATVFGLSKTWLFVLSAKPYYVNKTCFAWTTAEDLTVIDQLIGLDYHRDPA
ncbi:hypothetical protein [Brevundimonas sp.]|uniref:hypothetical protein n=1 Tax=Brevundimonas sp. TaxID=1871086 RepID=UPI001A2CC464|nr:hypothetical protein [Brevundimonas sp.]MBJ7486595.1 hypothetical protein [Brevundimonas sp.]